ILEPDFFFEPVRNFKQIRLTFLQRDGVLHRKIGQDEITPKPDARIVGIGLTRLAETQMVKIIPGGMACPDFVFYVILVALNEQKAGAFGTGVIKSVRFQAFPASDALVPKPERHDNLYYMKILAIETSCDETAIAVLEVQEMRFSILSNLVASQIKVHAPFGGVVPNLAKREHRKNLPILLKRTLKEVELPN